MCHDNLLPFIKTGVLWGVSLGDRLSRVIELYGSPIKQDYKEPTSEGLISGISYGSVYVMISEKDDKVIDISVNFDGDEIWIKSEDRESHSAFLGGFSHRPDFNDIWAFLVANKIPAIDISESLIESQKCRSILTPKSCLFINDADYSVLISSNNEMRRLSDIEFSKGGR